MRKQKLLALLLAAGMLVGMLAGCGDTKAEAPESVSPAAESSETASPMETNTNTEDAGAAEQVPESSAEEALTEEGKNLIPGTVASEALAAGKIDQSVSLPLCEEGETLTYWATTNFGASGGINSLNDHYGLNVALEQTGVKLEITEYNMTIANEQFSLMLASNDLCDIIVGFEGSYTPGSDNGIEEDIIIDLNDYLESAPIFNQLLEADPDWYESLLTDGGHLTSFKTLYTEAPWVRESVAIRGDWLEKLDMELPVTYDDYHEVLKAFKSEFDPAYCLDIGTTIGNNWFESGFGIGVAANGYCSSNDFYVEDGTVYAGYTSERFRDYLTMLHQWYEEDLISSDYVTIGNLEFFENDYSALLGGGQFGAVRGAGGLLESYAAFSDDPDFSMVASYTPRNNEDDTLCYLTPSTRTSSDYATSISAQCKNVELAMAFLDYFYSEEGSKLCEYGVEGQNWDYDENGEPFFTDVVTSQADTNGVLMAYQVKLPSVSDPNVSFRLSATEKSQGYMQFWTDDQNELMQKGNNAVYPSEASLNAEELEIVSNTMADIATYVSTEVPGFIMGTRSLDEFDAFCADIESMDIAAAVEAYQAAYDRYMK